MPKLEINPMQARIERLQVLLSKIRPVPAEWLAEVSTPGTRSGRLEVSSLPCNSYEELVAAWQLAFRWRLDLDYALSAILAVALSTMQQGDQLFLLLIGSPSSGKTKLCDGLLTSKQTVCFDHIKGFHSGYQDGSGDDFSFLARSNHKVWVTPEGDTLVKDPNFPKLMSEIRRIFDGTSSAVYKNKKHTVKYEGLRTPWIMAGTPKITEHDHSSLGDRFLKFRISDPLEDERMAISLKAYLTALKEVDATSNCSPESGVEPNLLRACRLTGGYVDWLRANTDLISQVRVPPDLGSYIIQLAEFTADMRARPARDYRKLLEAESVKEQPSRLVKQYVRLVKCLAVVLGRESVDDEVLSRATRVAQDTSSGHSFDIAKLLYSKGNDGAALAWLAGHVDQTKESTLDYMRFLRDINVVDQHRSEAGKVKSRNLWRLTERAALLWQAVVGD